MNLINNNEVGERNRLEPPQGCNYPVLNFRGNRIMHPRDQALRIRQERPANLPIGTDPKAHPAGCGPTPHG
ncbi:MAG: hypothetical protein WB611_15680, partial [Stellaceae bacterium]